MVPEITAMLHVAQEQGLAMVRGLEMLEILADFVEIANRHWCRTVQTFLEEDSIMKARKSASELQRVRLKRQRSARPANCHQHR